MLFLYIKFVLFNCFLIFLLNGTSIYLLILHEVNNINMSTKINSKYLLIDIPNSLNITKPTF